MGCNYDFVWSYVIFSLFPLHSEYSRQNSLQIKQDVDKKPAEKPDNALDSMKPAALDSIPVLVNKQYKLPEDYSQSI